MFNKLNSLVFPKTMAIMNNFMLPFPCHPIKIDAQALLGPPGCESSNEMLYHQVQKTIIPMRKCQKLVRKEY